MRWIPASLLLSSLALAAVPYTLPIGVPAKASQVNRNFETLDSLIGDQIEQYTELRQTLVAQADSLRKDMNLLRMKVKSDSQEIAEKVKSQFAADTGWKALNLPKGTVIGLLVAAGPDGFLPGSDKIWQQVESFGGIDGLPLPLVVPAVVPVAPTPAPVVPASAPAPTPAAVAVGDSASLAKTPADTVNASVAATAPAAPAATPTPAPTPAPPAVAAPAATVPAVTKSVFHWYVKVK